QLAPQPSDGEPLSIKKRLNQTRFLTPAPVPGSEPADGADDPEKTTPPGPRYSLSRALSQLYRLALDMASASSYEGLVQIVLDGLLEGVPAEVGAILTVKEGRELEVTAHRHRDPSIHTYVRVPERVSNDVLNHREGILAENPARDRQLRNRERAGNHDV